MVHGSSLDLILGRCVVNAPITNGQHPLVTGAGPQVTVWCRPQGHRETSRSSEGTSRLRSAATPGTNARRVSWNDHAFTDAPAVSHAIANEHCLFPAPFAPRRNISPSSRLQVVPYRLTTISSQHCLKIRPPFSIASSSW